MYNDETYKKDLNHISKKELKKNSSPHKKRTPESIKKPLDTNPKHSSSSKPTSPKDSEDRRGTKRKRDSNDDDKKEEEIKKKEIRKGF